MDVKDLIKKYALQNAIKFKGKANPGAIIGKLFAVDQELKKQAKQLSQDIQEVLKEIHQLSVEEQTALLEKIAPELLEKKEQKERDMFGFLEPKEGMISAFPPGPEKYPHIGHAKACLLNFMLAKEHKGKFILRFEDTNPKTTKKEYYDAMLKDFEWLGISWDELLYASDFMDLFYEKIQELIASGDAYIDRASPEELKESREKGTPTKDRDNSIEENQKLWEEMKKASPGEMIVRLKIDLAHKNSTMKDPTMFRIIEEEHARQGKKYRVWPNYDFQNAIMDSYSNIDLRLRSKEFELRGELQRWIQEKLGMKQTKTYEFGRFNMTGTLSSGRIIREKVESKELIGWDDPSLTTLAALRRRGFLPDAIKSFVLATGMSKAEATTTWDDLILHNKRLLDNSAKRFSAIFDPVQVKVENAPSLKGELHLNPNEKKGGRPFETTDTFFLSEKDLETLEQGELIRLMDCMNVLQEETLVYDSEEFSDFKGKGKKVINWLPEKDNIDIEVLMPDKTVKKGIAEKHIESLEEGDIIQFERFGFCRLDSKKGWKFWFTHK